MKNLYDKVKRFGSPTRSVQTRSGQTASVQHILEGAAAAPTVEADNDEDRENNMYNEYETKYLAEITPHKVVFSEIYESERLGKDGSTYYTGSSGTGATYDYNRAEFVPFLRQFIVDNQIRTVVDLGCGNQGYAQKVYPDLAVKAYYGYDVYGRVQEHNRRFSNHKKYHFFCMDFLVHREELVPADLCIIKDVLQHWTAADIYTLLDYLVASKKYKYIMIINCCDQRGDIRDDAGFKTGDWRKLSCKWLPLRKYAPKPVLYYKTKEVSVIQCYLFASPSTSRHASPFSGAPPKGAADVDREILRAMQRSKEHN